MTDRGRFTGENPGRIEMNQKRAEQRQALLTEIDDPRGAFTGKIFPQSKLFRYSEEDYSKYITPFNNGLLKNDIYEAFEITGKKSQNPYDVFFGLLVTAKNPTELTNIFRFLQTTSWLSQQQQDKHQKYMKEEIEAFLDQLNRYQPTNHTWDGSQLAIDVRKLYWKSPTNVSARDNIKINYFSFSDLYPNLKDKHLAEAYLHLLLNDNEISTLERVEVFWDGLSFFNIGHFGGTENVPRLLREEASFWDAVDGSYIGLDQIVPQANADKPYSFVDLNAEIIYDEKHTQVQGERGDLRSVGELQVEIARLQEELQAQRSTNAAQREQYGIRIAELQNQLKRLSGENQRLERQIQNLKGLDRVFGTNRRQGSSQSNVEVFLTAFGYDKNVLFSFPRERRKEIAKQLRRAASFGLHPRINGQGADSNIVTKLQEINAFCDQLEK